MVHEGRDKQEQGLVYAFGALIRVSLISRSRGWCTLFDRRERRGGYRERRGEKGENGWCTLECRDRLHTDAG